MRYAVYKNEAGELVEPGVPGALRHSVKKGTTGAVKEDCGGPRPQYTEAAKAAIKAAKAAKGSGSGGEH